MYFSLDYSLSLSPNAKIIIRDFFFLYWSIKNQFISFRLQAVAGFYACTSHSMPCAYICSFFCSLVAWRIPICMLIRCQNNNNNVMIQVKKSASAHYCCCCCCWTMWRFVQCGDRPNYYFSCYMCYITGESGSENNERKNSHAQNNQTMASCQIAWYQCRVECKNPYTRDQHTHT